MTLEANPHLLTPIFLSSQALAAQEQLIYMLNALPNHSVVWQFIVDNLNHPVHVNAFLDEGNVEPLQIPDALSDNYTLNRWPTDSGVYLLMSLLGETMQYLGSSWNMHKRVKTHIGYMRGPALKNPDLTNKYDWSRLNHGTLYWQAFVVYSTFNFYLEFVQKYPLHALSVGEYDILIAFSAFVPRILEQSLLNVIKFDWNRSSKVTFSNTSWHPCLLNKYGSKKAKSSPVEVRDSSSNELIRTFPSITQARSGLGLKSSKSLMIHINRNTAFKSSVLKRFIKVVRIPKPPFI